VTELSDWVRDKKKSMPFGIPMILRIPKNHHTDCYFCSVNVKGFSKRNKNKLSYQNLESAIRPDDFLPLLLYNKDSALIIEDDNSHEAT